MSHLTLTLEVSDFIRSITFSSTLVDVMSDLYKYKPLAQGANTRLLKLKAASGGPLECELIETLVESHPESTETLPRRADLSYEALSYTWDASIGQDYVLCYGRKLLVTKNCEAALRQLRYSQNDRLLWVDAICIDQNNINERSQQVGIMGDIYKSAIQVIVWLGIGNSDSDLAFKFLSEFKNIMGKKGMERDHMVLSTMGHLKGMYY